MCSCHLPHPFGSQGAAKLLRPPPAQRIFVDLTLQKALCLVLVCKEDPALASFLTLSQASEPPALLAHHHHSEHLTTVQSPAFPLLLNLIPALCCFAFNKHLEGEQFEDAHVGSLKDPMGLWGRMGSQGAHYSTLFWGGLRKATSISFSGYEAITWG